MRNRCSVSVSLLVALASGLACGSAQAPSVRQHEEQPLRSSEPTEPKRELIDESENWISPEQKTQLEAWGQKLARTLNGADEASIDSRFDKKGFVEKALGYYSFHGSTKTSFLSNVETVFQGATQVEDSFYHWHFLGFRTMPTFKALVLRGTRSDGAGLNYWILPLAKGDGKWKVVDSLFLAGGVSAAWVNASFALTELFTQGEHSFARDEVLQAKAVLAASQNQWSVVLGALSELEAIADLDSALVDLKLLASAYLTLNTESEESRKMLSSELESRLKDPQAGPAVLLIAVEYFSMQRRTSSLLAAINRLDEVVNDPYLLSIRALASEWNRDFSSMVRYAEEAVIALPDEAFVLRVGLRSAYYQKDFEMMLERLTILVDELNATVDIERIASGIMYPGFEKSEEGKKFIDYYRRTRSEPPAEN